MKASPIFFAITNLIFAFLFTYFTYTEVCYEGWTPWAILMVMLAASNFRSSFKMFKLHSKTKAKKNGS